MPSYANLFAAILFGSAGFAAFIYGKKSANWKPMTLGVILMVYPYFIEETWLLYVIGAVLTAGIFVWRD
ncbi:MAG: hypothetical protein NUV75_12160 [Gallionella sp.]|nr:hypothetical protein [Gallionella sp.]